MVNHETEEYIDQLVTLLNRVRLDLARMSVRYRDLKESYEWMEGEVARLTDESKMGDLRDENYHLSEEVQRLTDRVNTLNSQSITNRMTALRGRSATSCTGETK